jgi:MYXO-CTERM domain-containing protein
MRSSTALLVAALALAPVSAHAQTSDATEIEVGDDRDEGEGNSKLGLLGLLGLAGLLGLRRKEPDIHVDAR